MGTDCGVQAVSLETREAEDDRGPGEALRLNLCP